MITDEDPPAGVVVLLEYHSLTVDQWGADRGARAEG